MQNLNDILRKIIDDGCHKITISNPAAKSAEYKKIVAELKNGKYYISKYTEKQVFHESADGDNICSVLYNLVERNYKQLNASSERNEHIVLISKKGACNYKVKALSSTPERTEATTHNRKKNYILKEGEIIMPLIDMGIYSKDGKIINSMYSKYKQINRFLEIIDDEISKSKKTDLNVIDFGCGKSYLTFILYYYLTEIKKLNVNMIGLDLKADVIEKCNAAAKKYGYSALRFELGDINGYKAPFDVDMVVSLHACDTATDYALYNAVSWNAEYIFSVPCCQHELNSQIAPRNLSLLTRYGIIQERFSALATDAIRANMLEYKGYKTQLLEFIDLDHTPKNILVRAVRNSSSTNAHRAKMLSEAEAVMNEFSFEPTIYKLLK